MGREAWPDLSLRIAGRRRSCVPCPDLCLSETGAALLRGLAGHAELWLTPEFLTILDNVRLYDREPDLLRPPPSGRHPDDGWPNDGWAGDVRQALRIWACLRDEAGRAGGLLHWVRDAPHESCLPPELDAGLLPRWEALAEALDARLPRPHDAGEAAAASGPLIAAMRDSVALAAVLGGAAMLCRRDPAAPALPPLLCRHLAAWDLPCRRLPADDALVARDRSLLLGLIVEAGLAGFLWDQPRLAVVRLLVPGAAALPAVPWLAGGAEEPDFLTADEPRPVRGAWDGARAFWYDLTENDDA